MKAKPAARSESADESGGQRLPRRSRRAPRLAAKISAPVAAIKLPSDLGIDATASLHEQLAPHYELPEPVAIDAADVQRIHTAALQLFLMFCRDRYLSGRETTWRDPSAALQAAASVLGIAEHLHFSPAVEPALQSINVSARAPS